MTVAVEERTEQAAPRAASSFWSLGLSREAALPLAIFAAIMVAGGVLRFWDLGARAFHHDESLHATFSWRFSEGLGYTHDPLMHGPFQFHGTALSFVLFGDGDYQARIMPALFGTALIAMAWLLRDRVGAWGVVFLGAFLAFSPTLLYFSRFIREDIFTAVWTLGLVIALWRYIDRGQARYLVTAAALLAFSFATKETTFVTMAVFIAYFDLYASQNLAEQTRDGRPWAAWRRAALTAAYAPFAWAIVALWPLLRWLRGKLRLRRRTPAMDVVLLLGTLTLPQFAAIIGAPIDSLGSLGNAAPSWFQPAPGIESTAVIGVVTVGALVTVIALIAATALVGVLWNWRVWLIGALVFYGIYFALFTTFFTNEHGVSSSIWGSLDYWIEQQDVKRGEQPGFYYLMLLPVYEFLPLLIGLAAAAPLALRGDPFSRFLMFWFGMTLLGLSLAGEKMPWLSVHLALPLAVLATYAASRAARRVEWRRLRPLWPRAWAAGAVVAAFALLAALTIRASITASFGHDADGARPVEMLVYTQTSPELLGALRRIEAQAESSGAGRSLPIYIDSAEGLAWPWAWYLRDYRSTMYVDFSTGFEPPAGSVALVYGVNEAALKLAPGKWERAATYTHRWWFPETYRNTSLGGFAGDLLDGSAWQLWWRYFYDREPPDEIGRLEAALYLPAGGGR